MSLGKGLKTSASFFAVMRLMLLSPTFSIYANIELALPQQLWEK